VQFINKTNNTVYLQDIDLHIPFLQDTPQFLESDNILKSSAFQQMVLIGSFQIVSINGTRIEKNLKRQQDKMASLKKKMTDVGISLNNEPTLSDSTEKSVYIKGHFLEAGGYAKQNRNLAIGLSKLGMNVKIEVIGNNNQLSEDEIKAIAPLRGYPTRNSIRIDSIIPSFGNCSTGKYNILYTTVESYSIPQQFIDIANHYREIWVTADFCKKVLVDSGVKRPIYVFPCCVNTDLYSLNGDEYQFRPELNDFVFVSVFGWSYRKGYDLLLRAYLEEFTSNDNVSLLLVSRLANKSERSDAIKNEVETFINTCDNKNPPHIARCSKVIAEHQMPSLYRACDAFALFSRGEGFGLTYCESSLCGLPVISTKCSAQEMFLKDDNSYLLEVDSFENVPPGLFNVHYWDNQKFPSLKSQQALNGARKLLREVYTNHNQAKRKNEKLRKFILKNYSINNCVERVSERLNQIWSEIC
jgi:glycosyltransferase involved in cell wall biosynthesis